MIELINVSKKYRTRSGTRIVLNSISLRVEKGEKVGILGRNGAGKSTMVRMLGGTESPTSGSIRRDMSISWPLAFGGGFQRSLTGLDNLKFICRIYGVDYQSRIDYIDNFSELGEYLHEPVITYSAGMRARLAFALSLAIEFDCYLIDEVLAVGDSRFRERCRNELFVKRDDRAMIIVSHNADEMRKLCNTLYVLNDGHILKFNNIDQAYEYYNHQQNQNPA